MRSVGYISRLWRVVTEYLYPARCVSCKNEPPMGIPAHELMMKTNPDGCERQCFCEECYGDFVKSCQAQCPVCKKEISACECVTAALYGAGIRHAYTCFEYDKHRVKSAASQFIFGLKGTENRDCVEFAAQLLASRIKNSDVWHDAGSITITYAPRSRENVRRYGADHMRLTAKLVSKQLGCGFEDVFINGSDGEQKSMKFADRVAAASQHRLRRGVRASGRRFIVIDDIITSGATLGACVDLLYGAGASEVSVFALAKTRR